MRATCPAYDAPDSDVPAARRREVSEILVGNELLDQGEQVPLFPPHVLGQELGYLGQDVPIGIAGRELTLHGPHEGVESKVLAHRSRDEILRLWTIDQRGEEQLLFFMEMANGAPEVEVEEVIDEVAPLRKVIQL
jgi:hypothetical protein